MRRPWSTSGLRVWRWQYIAAQHSERYRGARMGGFGRPDSAPLTGGQRPCFCRLFAGRPPPCEWQTRARRFNEISHPCRI